jgi:hypothetical protein
MGSKLTYRETKSIKPKNKTSKYTVKTITSEKIYRNDDGQLVRRTYTYRKVVEN